MFALVVTAILEGTLRSDVLLPGLAVATSIVLSFGLLWRRSHPLTVVAVTFGEIAISSIIVLATGSGTFGLGTMAFILLLPYALHRWGSGREIVIGLAIILTGYATAIAADWNGFGEAAAALVFALSPALIGATVRYRSYAKSRDRAAAVLTEREQLARELHDTVAHHVSAIAIQAQAGRTLSDSDPGAPLRSLRVIEEEASKTLAEMRVMVGALRQGEEPELAPVPGLAEISRLATGSDESPKIVVEVNGDVEAISPAVDAALYRLAQESTTNARRHARNATTVVVSVAGNDDEVQITVTDDGDPTTAGARPEPGFGLIGMSERAKLVGGRLEAGPVEAGGWAVRAWLPKSGVAS